VTARDGFPDGSAGDGRRRRGRTGRERPEAYDWLAGLQGAGDPDRDADRSAGRHGDRDPGRSAGRHGDRDGDLDLDRRRDGGRAGRWAPRSGARPEGDERPAASPERGRPSRATPERGGWSAARSEPGGWSTVTPEPGGWSRPVPGRGGPSSATPERSGPPGVMPDRHVRPAGDPRERPGTEPWARSAAERRTARGRRHHLAARPVATVPWPGRRRTRTAAGSGAAPARPVPGRSGPARVRCTEADLGRAAEAHLGRVAKADFEPAEADLGRVTEAHVRRPAKADADHGSAAGTPGGTGRRAAPATGRPPAAHAHPRRGAARAARCGTAVPRRPGRRP